MSELVIKRRRLPHWELAGATYFVTWRIHPKQPPLAHSERALVAGALRYFHRQRYFLYPYTVLDNHGHALVRPYEGWPLDSKKHSWFSWTGLELTRNSERWSPLWLGEAYDRIVRGPKEFDRFGRYTLRNAAAKWPSIDFYPHMGIDGDTAPASPDEWRELMASVARGDGWWSDRSFV